MFTAPLCQSFAPPCAALQGGRGCHTGAVRHSAPGWFRPGGLSRRQPAERDATYRIQERVEERQAERERRILFGAPVDSIVSTVRMMLSGWVFDWRADGYFRSASPEQVADRVSADWIGWSGSSAGITSTGQAHPGDYPYPTWWQSWGQARPDEQVACRLADDTQLEVIRLGGLWICEWCSLAQQAFVRVAGGQVQRLEFIRPHYLPLPRPGS